MEAKREPARHWLCVGDVQQVIMKTCERCAGRGVVVTGAEMRAKREATDASLQDVANVLGKTRAAISAMELDRVAWTARLAEAYEQALLEAAVRKAAAKAAQSTR